MSYEPSVEPSVKPPEAEASTPSAEKRQRNGQQPKADSRPNELPANWPVLESEAARIWMSEIADGHPYLDQFSGTRRRSIRRSLDSLIEARLPHVWTDGTGASVPWRVRPAAWELALDTIVREGGRLENIIRLVALPQLLDPFKPRVATSSAEPAVTDIGGPLGRIDLPDNLSRDARALLVEWARANPEKAEELVNRAMEDPRWGNPDKATRPEERRKLAGTGFVVLAMPLARRTA